MDKRHQDHQFHTTRWSMVFSAGGETEPQRQMALESLCSQYWRPLFAYCLRSGKSPEDAEDLTQGFFEILLARNSLRLADPNRGHFRTFMLSAFRHHIIGEWDRGRALKRGGGIPPISLDAAKGFEPKPEVRDAASPEEAFDRQWAEEIIARAVIQLRKEQTEGGKQPWFDWIAGQNAGLPYATVASMLGTTEDAIKSHAKRLRFRFREIIEATVADTVGSHADLKEEIRYIVSLLRK